MADVTVRFKVLENKLPALIKGMEPIARQIVAKAALDIQGHAQQNAPVDTGTLKNSIQATQIGGNAASGSISWRVVVGADYGMYVEWGTVHMAARPFFRPAIDAVRPAFLQAMKQVTQG
jgi:HK97 gp10 family phage protein